MNHPFHELKGDFHIRIESRFEASHYLYSYFPDGSDEPMHGHSWKVELDISRAGGGLGKDGISYDFVEAKKRLDKLISVMDHSCINDLEDFNGINPTSENIARWFYGGLRDSVAQSGGEIKEIRIFEGPNFLACFRPE
jgi:6-pyruvoyltetrahydropterin/6-carboxytetrahydropterin synthase